MTLSLMEAIASDSLDLFIEQEENRGIEPISEAEFNDTASRVIRTPQSNDQTSSFIRYDDLPEK